MVKGESSFSGQAEPSTEAEGFVVDVVVLQVNESSPRPYAIVKLTNQTTNETVTKTANSSGEVSFVLGTDLDEEGYEQGHAIKIEQVIDDDDMEYFVTGNGDATYPTWVRCDNSTRTQIRLNTARIKLDLTRYPEGQSVKITQTNS